MITARWGDLKIRNLFPALKYMGFWDLTFGRGHFENCIRSFKMHQKWVQMIPNTISDIFQPRIDFSYGLDVEIRPKLTPGAGTQVQYSTGQPATATATAPPPPLAVAVAVGGHLAPSGLRSENKVFQRHGL